MIFFSYKNHPIKNVRFLYLQLFHFLQFASEFIVQSKYFFWGIQNNFIFFAGSVHKNYLL